MDTKIPLHPKVLIVDDVPINLKVLRAHLEPSGYQVLSAESGEEALVQAEKKPDLILLDIMMPEMDGMETCRRLKANPDTADIPVIFLSALTDPESRTGALAIGGVDFIIKPFDEEELVARVKIHLTLRYQKIQLEMYAAELEQMVEDRTRQLIHADRLATLGTFSAGMAHEINNPNTFIAGNIQVLQLFWKTAGPILKKHIHEEPTGRLLKTVNEIEDIFEDMLEGSRRISSIVNSLKTYAHQGGVHKENIKLMHIVDDALKLLQHRLKKGISIQVSVPSELIVYCDYQSLSQVFVNILNNSIDAIDEDSGKIDIIAETVSDQIQVLIQDNGPGIPETIADKIFDPFFTTKGKARGTGLGLSIVKGIVEKHDGKIFFEKRSIKGASFLMTLPTIKNINI
ncbi:response regulator receiver sensor signal transduction histidine kinase [Candidatus Magnetomorum sp. HK-1]|nr:response regulator receiver sensor signal transduction histidine kinase [Candidatus Magnetomorum sp. HK-1]